VFEAAIAVKDRRRDQRATTTDTELKYWQGIAASPTRLLDRIFPDPARADGAALDWNGSILFWKGQHPGHDVPPTSRTASPRTASG